MRKTAQKVLFVFCMIALAPLTAASAETNLTQAEDYVRTLGTEAVSLLKDNNGNQKERRNAIRSMLKDNLALERIGRIIYGRGWRKASDDERSQYQSLFSEYILSKYTYLIGGYSGETFKVMGSQPAGRSDALVTTAILKDGQTSATVDWRITEEGPKLAILDVKIEKSSMVQTEKSQFQAVLNKDGHEGLVKALQQQIARIQEKEN